MKCCEKCFRDPEIVSVIRSANRIGECPLCKSEGVFVYDSEQDVHGTLRTMFETITDAFIPYDADRDRGLPNGAAQSLAWYLKHETRIFKIKQGQVASFLLGLMPDKAYLAGKVVPKYLRPNADGVSIIKGYSWQEFVDLLKHKVRFGATKYLDSKMMEIALNDCEVQIPAGTEFVRARILNGEQIELSESAIGAPPVELCCGGRVNPRGIRMLYVADSEKTALTECRSRIMDEVCVAKFRAVRNLKIADLSKISLLSPWSVSNDFAYYLKNIPMLESVAKSFSRALNNYDNKLDYLGTQFICEYIRLNGWDGVAYGSTLAKHGKNYAIFNPDDAMVVPDSIEKICISSVSPRWKVLPLS